MPLKPKHESNQIALRALKSEDFPRLVDWINTPHVARWWDGKADLSSVTEEYGPTLEDNSETSVFVIEMDQGPVGIVQCYRHRDCPEWERDVDVQNAAGIDYLIGEPDSLGKGIGSEAIRAITKIAFDLYPEVEFVVSVPQRDNVSSCRALESAGFDLVHERKLQSKCPSDEGISRIYSIRRR
jgi:aminoglycoside 6'-N-acetyltransferase